MTAALRVVSLVPSVTETLLAWSITPVAVTRFCEQPQLPAVGGTKDPDVTAIIGLAPDVVVVNDEENRIADADELREAGVRVHNVHVRSVDEVSPAFAELASELAVEVPAIVVPNRPESAAVVAAFVPIWRRPWMTINADTYGSSLLGHVGITNVFAGDADRFPETSLDEVARARPGRGPRAVGAVPLRRPTRARTVDARPCGARRRA